ncbi:hypothetical protein CEH05_07555 [Halobacillus halophilus]|uniref:Flagellar protein FliL n=1 Tax=Halobacillus halophilus (strain ATCC 35676 / DSM 2266 / JCM 20832 / KCTC 3685 / LMG 17431 / NBRC 102448 / NCIMB 2269) TaxID=866895 RepID=I0JL29_HALH3|nr:hypothetical protein [Halobacillus halophilus]ASF38974.1 hypothetical protein CEH05_07555 [Halobacillus halophilus]CCG44849.1 hypothetical protein HBHAL_2505 [Halobacillus halophilus DSM 2266]
MKKKNFILIFFVGLAIALASFFSVSLMASEKKLSDETIIVDNKEVSSKYFNDLNERTANLGESIIKNLDGTKYRLNTILLLAEKYPVQVIYLKSTKEATVKEKQHIKDKIHNIIKSKNFSEKETFEIVFEGNENI